MDTDRTGGAAGSVGTADTAAGTIDPDARLRGGGEADRAAPERAFDEEQPVPLYPLVFLVDGDEVTVGRVETDSYAIFPPDGAELVLRLQAGDTPREAARWYEQRYGEPTDVDHVLAALDELGFVRPEGDGLTDGPAGAAPPAGGASSVAVRWQRLGTALFSPPALFGYGLVVVWALVAMARSPQLVPTYRNLFFTQYFTVIELVMFVAAVPLIAMHEAFHSLAGRRLGVRSTLRFGHRLHFLVVETSLDGLVAVPRNKRYLPILAGMLADLMALSAFTVLADLTRNPAGGLSLFGRICLAVAYTILLRLLWQFFLYLQTDIYVLITTLFHCVDLHATAKRILANRFWRLVGRPDRCRDESDWHPVDARVGAWYSWLIVGGYTVSLSTFVLAVAPAAITMFGGAFGRFGGVGVSGWALTDSVVFLAINLAQIGVVIWISIRDRRRRQAGVLRHVVA